MPRTPTVRYFESRQAYYTQYQGRQHLLAAGPKDDPAGPTYRAAVERFARLMHLGEEQRVEDGCLVSEVIARYYHHLTREGKSATLHLARTMLDPAIADFGSTRVRDLKPYVVTDWLAKMAARKAKGRVKPWGPSTQNTAACKLSRAFSWAVAQGFIAKSPVAGMAKAEKLVRGKEVVMPEALEDLLIEEANPQLSKLLRFLRGTGARPGEAIHAECRHFKPDLQAVVLPWNPPPGEYRWKTASKTKRDRVIYLTPELAAMVEGEAAARGGHGRVFVTARGRAWNNNNLTNSVIRLAGFAKVKEWCKKNRFDAGKIMCYGLRHGYITRMLTRGCPIKVLADLCGTSVAMIERTYSHAHDDHLAMRRLFLQFSAAPSAPPGP